ncbi:putative esterase [Methylophilaceae bacterium 11]|uniref:alpha/beta hydrolase n=1 Tax=Methylotenera sp. 1P/1 TaxID=1131551 RepID=UPI00036764A3|nr:dienelactone hydrolase family protein [Methylotenera sp. 1P/1]EUJ09872.1 putative esterase [Methylophilaceae bacterium 11]
MLDYIKVSSQQHPTACVIWLHGLGADGYDFEPVVEMLNLPHIYFMLPHAPYKKITMNNGYEMRAWYDLFGLDKDSPQDAVGIKASQTEIKALIAHANTLGIPTNRIALAGFSQGGAIALHTALRHTQTLAGVLALSTYLPLKHTLPAQKSIENQSIPIFMAHGIADEVIRIDTALSSRQQLQDAGYAVEWHEYPMAHSVNANEIADIRQFLLKILP